MKKNILSLLIGVMMISAVRADTQGRRELLAFPPSGPESAAPGLTESSKSVTGDRFRIIGRKKVIKGGYMAPLFAGDGDRLLLTGESFRGLWLLDPDDPRPEMISKELMAGWRPVVSRGGEIIFRSAVGTVNGETAYRISSYNPASRRRRLLYQGEGRDIYPPVISPCGKRILFVEDRKTVGIDLSLPKKPTPAPPRVVFADGGKIWVIEEDATPREISNGRETCGGEVLSPDGNRVAYLHGNSDGIIVYDFRTGKETVLGPGSSLTWSPDSNYLLYNIALDDGSAITESDLFVAAPDGGYRQRLTATRSLDEMNPDWSPDGKKIVCEDAACGDIYLMELSAESSPAGETTDSTE
mgnify:CR=1 FL=1